jgi:peptide/nickel transport system ATP-binding protein
VTFRSRAGAARALRGVSLDVVAGEVLAVVGESGSGKTVLGLSLLGLLPSDPGPLVEGQIRVAGVDVTDTGSAEVRVLRAAHLGAVFQDPMTSLNPTMTVGDQLCEVAEDRAHAARLLADVGVPEPAARLDAYPHELSGGQRQRVMIAMAVARRPSLIVLDEPTTALDVTVQAQVLDLLADLRRLTGSSMVFITHDLGVAAQIADRIAVMYAGRVVELGDAAQVLSAPGHPYTRALLRSRLALDSDRDRRIPQMAGELPPVWAEWSGCAYGPRCGSHVEACDRAVPALDRRLDDGHLVACVNPVDAGPPPAPLPNATVGGVRGPDDIPLRVLDLEVGFERRTGIRSRVTVQALRGISLDVGRGECVALVGESGCGKSTLLRAIAGLVARSGGEVLVGGEVRPQMVFQDAGASLTPWLTVGQLVEERLSAAGVGRAAREARVRETLELVGLPVSLLHAKPQRLSGGQRQRLAFARAVVIPPPLLLADEPTSALDVSLAAVVLNLVGSLRRELAMAVLFVTHDIAAARMVADRIAVMYLGRIVEQGPAAEVTSRPMHPYTEALVGAVPVLGRRSPRVLGEPASPVNPPAGCAYHPRCPVRIAGCDEAVPGLRPAAADPRRLVACVHAEAGR